MKTAILSFLLSLTFYSVYACTCSYAGNFSKVAKEADLVALVKVLDHDDYFSLFPEYDSTKKPMSVRVEIVVKYSGNEDRKEVKLFGDNGYLCRESILQMKEGEYYVVAVHKSKNHTWEYGVTETNKDYYISACGEYLLSYNPAKQTVKGSIKGKSRLTRVMSVEKFEQILKKGKVLSPTTPLP